MSTIFKKFFNSVLILSFFPIVSVLIIIFYFQQISKKEIIYNYQKLCDSFAMISYENINNFAKRLEYISYLKSIYLDDEKFFNFIRDKYSEIIFVAILDKNGIEIKRKSYIELGRSIPIVDISKETYFNELKKDKNGVIGDFAIRAGLPLATVVYPIQDGFIYSIINLRDFFANIYLTRIGETGFVFYISDEGKILGNVDVKLKQKDIFKIISSEWGNLVIQIGNNKYLFVYRKLSSFDIYVVIAQKYREVFRNVNILFYWMLFILFLVLTVSYFISYFSAKKLTDPITAVVEQSYKVSEGDFSGSVDVKSDIKEMNTLIGVFNKMISKLKEYENIQIEKIMDEREKLNTIMQNIKNGVALTKISGEPIYMNEACLFIISEGQARDFFHQLVNKTSYERSKVFEKNSKYYEFTYDIIKLQRDFPMLLFVIEDVTAEVNIYKAKEEVFRSIVHDVRTPLLNMQGYIKLLSYDANEKTRKYLSGLENESLIIFRMLENILDMARIENKTISLNRSKIDIVKFIEKISERFLVRAEFKNIKFNFFKNIETTFVEIDEELFQRALDNVISNAFKYTPSGGSVVIEIEKLDNKINIYVKDTGKGIEKDKIKTLFEKFRSFSKDGFGLGLQITKAIIDMHDGSIKINSEEGKGTTVIISINEVK
ncbi:MAG: ATP-binding protein [Elusimicrobiales bacterium]|nr:ATP-binding protein [Elusimicrobiales bacterium]